MIILRHDKFISGMRIYKSGEILPDTSEAHALVARGLAEVVNTEKSAKTAKKKAQPQPVRPAQPVQVQTPQPQPVTQTMQNSQQNDQGNS